MRGEQQRSQCFPSRSAEPGPSVRPVGGGVRAQAVQEAEPLEMGSPGLTPKLAMAKGVGVESLPERDGKD